MSGEGKSNPPALKSPNSLLSWFQPKKSASKIDENQNKQETKTTKSDTNSPNDFAEEVKTKKKRKNKKDHSSESENSKAKKLRLSQSSDDNETEIDSGIICSGTSEKENQEEKVFAESTDDSVCEVSYLDFMCKDEPSKGDDEKSVPLPEKSSEDFEITEIASPEIDKNQKSITSFFSPTSSKPKSKEIKIDNKCEESNESVIEVNVVDEIQTGKKEKKKKTQMTFDFSGKGMKLTKLEEPTEPEVTKPETEESDDLILLSAGSDKNETENEVELRPKSKKKRKKKVSEAIHEIDVDKSDTNEVISIMDAVDDANVVDYKDFLDGDVKDPRPKRSLFDVMSEARKQRKSESVNRKSESKSSELENNIEESKEDEKKPKAKKKTTAKSKKPKTSEPAEDFADDVKENKTKPKKVKKKANVETEEKVPLSNQNKKSAKRKSSPLKSPGGSDVLYASQLVDSEKTGSPWKLRMTRLRTRQISGEPEKTKKVQLAQQILNKAKRNKKDDAKKTKPKKETEKAATKSKTKKDTTTKDSKKLAKNENVAKVEGTKSGKMAAIFQKKKKPTKAELKALAEQKARREAFLAEGIPTELRQQVAQSIQATDAISVHLPFPILGQSHIGSENDCKEAETEPNCEFKYRKMTSVAIPSGEVKLGQFTSIVESTIEKREIQFKGSIKFDESVIQDILNGIKLQNPDFPVQNLFESLQKRKSEEIEKYKTELQNQVVQEMKSPEVITLDDEEEEKGAKKKTKRRKSKAEKKSSKSDDVTPAPTKTPDVIDNKGDVMLSELYAPTTSSDLVGYNQVKKRLSSWLTEWKEKVDREERIMRKMLERQLKHAKKTEKKDEYDDDSDFRMSEEELSTGSSISNTVLLTGAHGLGKTSLVYALAQDLGYKVFEVSSSNKRTGKLLMSQLQEATQSQHVSKNNLTNSPCKTDKTNVFFASSCAKKKPSLIDQTKAMELLANRQSTCLSLILFDEVDVVFEEDKGFWQAIENFMKSTKKPMIMTSSERNFKFHFETPLEEMVLKTPKLSSIATYLSLVCLCEGYVVKSDDLLDLVSAFGADIRQCVNSLQFWLQSGGSQRTEIIRFDKTKAKIDNGNSSVQIPASKQKEMLSHCANSDEDDFQPRKMKSKRRIITDDSNDVFSAKNDVTRTDNNVSSAGNSHQIPQHLDLLVTLLNLDQKSVDFLTTQDNQSSNLPFNEHYQKLDLLHANSRTLLPLAKEHLSQAYPIMHKTKTENHKRRRIVSEDLYDDEKSNDNIFDSLEPMECETTDDKTCENEDSEKSSETAVKDTKTRLSEYHALEKLSRLSDAFSWSDSFLSSAKNVSASTFVTKSAGLDNTENLDGVEKLVDSRPEMLNYVQFLALKVAKEGLKNHWTLEPIPIELDKRSDVNFRLRHDFDQTVKSRAELSRCHSNAGQQLGPGIAIETSAMATDYLPTLRRIVKVENIKMTAKTKRRFFHYLDNISLNLSPSCLETLSTSF